MTRGKSVAKRYRFSQEELKVVPKGKGLNKIYKFNQEELKVVSRKNCLAKKG
jgi:hypothetical protein